MNTAPVLSNPVKIKDSGNGWIAVEKPAGISVHNQPGQDLCSVVTEMLYKNASLQSLVKPDPDFGIHPVHRLDKETSGILMMALTPLAFRFLSDQFESRQVKKTYIALLHGHVESSPKQTIWGEWNRPLAKAAGGRQNPQGSGPKQKSLTRYRVKAHSIHYSLVEIELLTGRKHQIRRHAALAGHPVAGDSRYGSKRAVTFLASHFQFNRLALHSSSITIQLPDRRGPVTIESSTVPDQIQQLFDQDLSESGFESGKSV